MKISLCRLPLAVSTVVALTVACEGVMDKPQEPEGVAVGFDLSVEDPITSVRALVADGGSLQNFWVFAAHTGAADFDTIRSIPDFMYRQLVTRSATGWGYTPMKYWPKGGAHKLSFFAYAPVDAPSLFTDNTQGGVPELQYTVPATAATQYDLLAADPLYNLLPQSAPVVFRFRHLLAQVNFAAQLVAAAPSGAALYLDRIELQGLRDRGRYRTRWTLDDPHTATYTLTTSGGDLVTSALTQSVAPLTTTSGTLLILPQRIAPTAVLILGLRMVQGGVTSLYTLRKPLAELLSELRMGSKYRILLRAGVAGCNLSYTVEPWAEKTANLPSFN